MIDNADSALRVPGAFNVSWVTVGRESLTLTDIEHGKIRRFGDPRIHAALVCGSVSCPTLRHQPYQGDIDEQLDDQMRSFLAIGGAVVDRDNGTLRLSRVLLWYGRDLVAPRRMPTLLPARPPLARGRRSALAPSRGRVLGARHQAKGRVRHLRLGIGLLDCLSLTRLPRAAGETSEAGALAPTQRGLWGSWCADELIRKRPTPRALSARRLRMLAPPPLRGRGKDSVRLKRSPRRADLDRRLAPGSVRKHNNGDQRGDGVSRDHISPQCGSHRRSTPRTGRIPRRRGSAK